LFYFKAFSITSFLLKKVLRAWRPYRSWFSWEWDFTVNFIWNWSKKLCLKANLRNESELKRNFTIYWNWNS